MEQILLNPFESQSISFSNTLNWSVYYLYDYINVPYVQNSNNNVNRW